MLKHRLKRRRHADFSSDTYTRRTRTGKLAIVRKGKRRKQLRPALIGLAGAGLVGAGLLLATRGKKKPRIIAPISKVVQEVTPPPVIKPPIEIEDVLPSVAPKPKRTRKKAAG